MSESDEMSKQENINLSKNNSTSLLIDQQVPECIKGNFLSEPTISIDKSNFAKKIFSNPNFGNEINYDDLCGQSSYPEIPAFQRCDIGLIPQICTWKFIEKTDMPYLKQFQDNKEAILSLIGNKLSNNILFDDINKDIFLELMWEIFIFTRDNCYTERAVSSLLGLFYLTHWFFLATLSRSTAETYKFFKEGVLLHSVLHPPKSDEIFTPAESKQALDLFWMVYMRQLALLRFICLPNYQLILTLDEDSPQS